MHIQRELEFALELITHGTVEIISIDELKEKLTRSAETKKPLIVKFGCDPSAPDIHLGHTVCLRKLKTFQQLGHTVVFIVGDFTAMIGDPSGRSTTRKPLSKEEVLENAKTYTDQVFKILDPEKTKVVFNSSWLAEMKFSEVIELSARYTVARILERDDFEKRYKAGDPISIHEFLYPLIQGYDSVAVHADVELGGTDQKFNLLVGREIQRSYGQEPQVIITMPILEGTDGKMKMSKSLGNYIGITEEPNEMFGKIMSIPDKLLIPYFTLLCDLEKNELEKIKMSLEDGSYHPRDAKSYLAYLIVKQYHGEESAKKAMDEFNRVFRDKQAPTEIPTCNVLTSGDKLWVVRLMKEAGIVNSHSEARRLISQHAVEIDNQLITDVNLELPADREYLFHVGRRFYKVVLRNESVQNKEENN